MTAKPFQPDERWERFAQAFLECATYTDAAKAAGIDPSTVTRNKKKPGFIEWLNGYCDAEIAEARHMADAKLSKCVLDGDVMTAEERGTLKMVYDRDKRINDRVKGSSGGNSGTHVPIEGGLTETNKLDVFEYFKDQNLLRKITGDDDRH